MAVQAMQVEGLAAAQAEIASAAQEMGWDEAEAAIMAVVQTVVMEEAELVGHGAGAQWWSWRQHTQ